MGIHLDVDRDDHLPRPRRRSAGSHAGSGAQAFDGLEVGRREARRGAVAEDAVVEQQHRRQHVGMGLVDRLRQGVQHALERRPGLDGLEHGGAHPQPLQRHLPLMDVGLHADETSECPGAVPQRLNVELDVVGATVPGAVEQQLVETLAQGDGPTHAFPSPLISCSLEAAEVGTAGEGSRLLAVHLLQGEAGEANKPVVHPLDVP